MIVRVTAFVYFLAFSSVFAQTYSIGWELRNYTIPRRDSPLTFATNGSSGSNAFLSEEVVDESSEDIENDNLPTLALYGKNWNTGNTPDLNKYIEFSVAPPDSVTMYGCHIQLPLFREISENSVGEEGPRKWVLRWSVDNFQTNIGGIIDITHSSSVSPAIVRIGLADQLPITSSVTFRLYGFDAASPEGAGGLFTRDKKLFIEGQSSIPLMSTMACIVDIQVQMYYDRIIYSGLYGESYKIQTSDDLVIWTDHESGFHTFVSCDGLEEVTFPKDQVIRSRFFRIVHE